MIMPCDPDHEATPSRAIKLFLGLRMHWGGDTIGTSVDMNRLYAHQAASVSSCIETELKTVKRPCKQARHYYMIASIIIMHCRDIIKMLWGEGTFPPPPPPQRGNLQSQDYTALLS